jgi:hypothetical protein
MLGDDHTAFQGSRKSVAASVVSTHMSVHRQAS